MAYFAQQRVEVPLVMGIGAHEIDVPAINQLLRYFLRRSRIIASQGIEIDLKQYPVFLPQLYDFVKPAV